MVKMGCMRPYGSVHTETCGNGNGNSNGIFINGNNIVINWVLCPIVTATAMTKISFAFAVVSMKETLDQTHDEFKRILPKTGHLRLSQHLDILIGL